MNTVQVLALLAVLCGGARGKVILFENRLRYTIWVGSQGNAGKPPISDGGFELPRRKKMSVDTPDDWAGRFWPRTGCNFTGEGEGHCTTGDCGNRLECRGSGGQPPVSLAEFTLGADRGLDYYDISLVDGFNIPMSIEPVGGQGDGGQDSCKKDACLADINAACPDELRVVVDGTTVACKSACVAFNTDQYCCRGTHSDPANCQSSDWPTDYVKFFKDQCPDAYSYVYDDNTSTFSCNAPAYLITFGSKSRSITSRMKDRLNSTMLSG